MKKLKGMGWIPDQPDIRDYTFGHSKVKGAFAALAGKQQTPKASASVDLRTWCSPVEDQLDLGSCTANAGAGMYEYFERRAFGKHVDCSRLFLYKVSRNLLGWAGDTGATIRTTMGALTLFGTPPERYLPYVVADFDTEPSAFCYAFAQNYQAIQYYRLDPLDVDREAFLQSIKNFLVAGYVSMIGFTVYSSFTHASSSGMIPFPVTSDRVVGGHAILLVGYDDNLKIKNASSDAVETKGALMFKNSWGTDWGASGYGWLPYEYVRRGLAVDCWTMIKGEWVETGKFGVPE